MTAIKANTSLALLGNRSSEEYREALGSVDSAADIMDRLIQDLLLLARTDCGELVSAKESVKLSDVFEDVVGLSVRNEPQAGVRVQMDPVDLVVVGDRHHLTRLFANLLDNALRHTPADGQIFLSAREDGGKLVIEMQDTGEGIAPEHLPYLFERFYRVDKARARKDGGSGLGLAICKGIVDAHGGTISISSEPGQGTFVAINLPTA